MSPSTERTHRLSTDIKAQCLFAVDIHSTKTITMSSISKYESLKHNGTFIDRAKYIVSLSEKSELENHLKQSLQTSYDDLKAFIFLSDWTKNEQNLLQIFQGDALPLKRRVAAGKSWIKLQKDHKQVKHLLIETINNPNVPR